ncbi:MAG TPA: FoF1 ATP synthase subunit gamma [Candidatus Binataceae bacterium]|nr:FoF1 ATP synthase subunit gamma [Candidatus Binataceae bacterium]
MARAQEIAAQTGSLKELGEIVAAIRVVAAAQMQESQRYLEGIRNYVTIIRNTVAEATALLPEKATDAIPHVARRSGLVVFGAEHGFCGAFNEPLIREAAGASRTQPKPYLIFAGTRCAQRSSEQGLHPDVIFRAATHGGGVSAAARRVAAEVYRLITSEIISTISVLYMRVSGSANNLKKLLLLPIEMQGTIRHRARIAPLTNMKPRRLRDELASEYVFALLEAAAMESFASENTARFHTMEAAHENIRTKSEELNRLARWMRQEAVTAEILEIIGGAEAMKGKH